MKKSIFQGNKNRYKVAYEFLIILVLLFSFVVMVRAVWRLWQKNEIANANLASSDERLTQLEERKRMLEVRISKLGTPRGLEEEIRTNFSVVKPGEKVVNIVEREEATTTATTTEVRRWWQIF
ncbi:MAG TPA: septum formation initiator family protein [Candidatus Paceibacterota bacterium]|nr:septum formation initiator family protein [Candidatus Paceibacterota bacterium]